MYSIGFTSPGPVCSIITHDTHSQVHFNTQPVARSRSTRLLMSNLRATESWSEYLSKLTPTHWLHS